MFAVVAIFGLPLLLAAAMISPADLRLTGLVSCIAVVLVASPLFAWRTLLVPAIFPSPGEGRSGSLLRLWIGGSALVVAVLYFIGSALDYPPAGIKIAADAHLLVPFAPRIGLAAGLFCLSMLVSCGCWGALAPLLRPEVCLSGAFITGCIVFVVVYGGGWLLVLS